jgi:hypothetical protein
MQHADVKLSSVPQMGSLEGVPDVPACGIQENRCHRHWLQLRKACLRHEGPVLAASRYRDTTTPMGHDEREIIKA